MSINKILIAMALGLSLTATSCVEEDPNASHMPTPDGSPRTAPVPEACNSDSFDSNSAFAVCKLETDDPSVVCFVNTREGALSCLKVAE